MSKKLIYLMSIVLVLWFSVGVASAQPLNQSSGPDGIVSVEAEHYDNKAPGQNGTGWEEFGPKGGFTGVAGMEVLNESTNTTTYVEESARLDYEINFVKTGTHYVWILAYGPDGSSDSCHAGLDGEAIPTLVALTGWNGDYEWNSDRMDTSDPPTFEVTSTGVHTFNIWMREDNLIVDKIVLTTNPDFSLTGLEPGPPESSRGALLTASDPNPADGATDVPRDVVLSWTQGEFAAPTDGHKVYFGESFNDVNDGTGGVAQSATSYALPQRLDFSTTYYWRVDEVNGPPDFTVFEGDVWSFTTEPIAYAIENITATASSTGQEGMGPENTINGSGLDADDLHSTEATDMWLSSDDPNGAWIEYEFDKVHKLHQMWVWNSNQTMESILGLGYKDVSIEYSVNGTDYTTLGTTHEFARAPGADGYEHNTTVDFGGAPAKYVRLTANSNWGGIMPRYGLSEVRFFSIPVLAREPNPDSGTTDVSIGTIDEPVDVTLGFRAGREADKHDVYFSSDWQAVADGNAPVATVTETSYGPLSLDLGTTYYWKINEVNEAETPTTWQSDIWNFTTQKYFVVDDFEDYNDYPPDEIWATWIDGYGVPTNGATVGYPDPDWGADEHYVETTIVHGGQQSMPYFYDNSGPANYSEATLTLSSQQDWTIKGIEALSLRFRGNPAGFVEGPAGTYTMTAAGVDIWNEADEFRYAWKQLSGDGEITATVESVLWVTGSGDWTKVGVMIRDTLDADSKNAFVALTTGSGDGATFQWRTMAGGSSSSSRTLVGISPPSAIRLVRQGNTFTSYVFLDGQWQQEGESATVAMTDPVYIGLALTSHSSGITTVAVFSDVQTTVSGPFTQQAIGVDMLTNDPAPMYVAVASSGGTPAVVYHDDPGATQVNTWTEWSINLTEFSNQGVVLTNVDSISIGFGDKANPQPGGTGLVYFDDIRLYPYREEIWFEAESADVMGASWRIYDDPASSGGRHIGSEDGDGNDNNTAPGAEWLAVYNFDAAGGVYKILLRAQEFGSDSFWVRIPGATSQTHEDPDQPGTGWVRFNGIDAPDGWAWDEVHSNDHSNAVVNWTLPAGAHTIEIAKREDGVLLDGFLITSNLGIDQTTLPDVIPQAADGP
ncbi:MAG: hypothetical protein IIC00_05575 [Planctomycetes bacterium]|nr:hypothetical protein [Planctomycetota bacterium]